MLFAQISYFSSIQNGECDYYLVLLRIVDPLKNFGDEEKKGI